MGEPQGDNKGEVREAVPARDLAEFNRLSRIAAAFDGPVRDNARARIAATPLETIHRWNIGAGG